MGAMGWGNFVLGTGPERQRKAMKHSSIPRNTSMQHKNSHAAFQELAITSATCIYPFRLAFSFSDGKISRKSRHVAAFVLKGAEFLVGYARDMV
jgi:hypothetical protein